MRAKKQINNKQEDELIPVHYDNDMNLWVLLDLTRDVISRARELELNHFKLTRMQAAMLFITQSREKGMTLPEISNWNLREPNSVLTLVNRMEKLGLVEKSRDSEEGKIRVFATEKGKKLYSSTTRQSIKMIFSALSPEEKRQLQSILKKLRDKGRQLLGIDYKPPFLP